MVFGTFDGVHDGHRHLFAEAKRHGDHLIAVVAPDEVVHDLKGHSPDMHAEDRMEHLTRESHVDEVVLGDAESGTWQVIRRHRPHVVVVGYDQNELRAELEAHLGEFPWFLEVHAATAHKPESHHTAVLRKKKLSDQAFPRPGDAS